MLCPAARLWLKFAALRVNLRAVWGGNITRGHWDSQGLLFLCIESLQQLRFCLVSLSYLRASQRTGMLRHTPGKMD